jgi:hypothetical protein
MLGERINRYYLQYTGTERRVNDERHLNHVEGVLPEGAMVVIDSQMLGRIEKIVDFKTTETTDHIRRHDVPHLDWCELFIVQIVRVDYAIGVAPLR